MLIKLQHNVWSNGQTYTGMTDPRIMHEYVIVTRKPMQFAWTVEVRRADHMNVDQRGVGGQTWHGIVWTALVALGNQASLGAIYDQVKDHARVRKAESSARTGKPSSAAFCKKPANRLNVESGLCRSTSIKYQREGDCPP